MAFLNEESLRHVEAGAAAHRVVVELAETRRQKLADTEHELKLIQLEVDRLRIDVQDMQVKLRAAEEDREQAVKARVAYETQFAIFTRLLGDFRPPVEPVHVYRPDPERSLEHEPPEPSPMASLPHNVIRGAGIAQHVEERIGIDGKDSRPTISRSGGLNGPAVERRLERMADLPAYETNRSGEK